MENYFNTLNSINVSDKTEKKNGLTYLSWAWAWGEVKKRFPDAAYTIYEDGGGRFYHTDGKTAWVKTGVTVNGIEHIEYLPVMDFRNASIPLEKLTSVDVNKSIQRSLTKAVARHGLGLYIYAGEDLPEADKPDGASGPESPCVCERCGGPVLDSTRRDGSVWPASDIVEYGRIRFHQTLCKSCQKALAKEIMAKEKAAVQTGETA